jgi:Predicted GTPases|uniref:GTPase RsgA n=1 Tax=Ignisphaera aggregans TaxID=334771 RepID=A0A7J3Z769_9CREN
MKLLKASEISKIVAKSDVIVEIVEARVPLELKSETIERAAKRFGKDYLLVLNKCDLVPRNICREWVEYFTSSHGIATVCVSALRSIGVKRLKRLFMAMLKGKDTLNVALFGLPKVGKSSIINALKGKDSATTSPYPGSWGYTKGITVYKITPGIYIIDTPGYIPFDVRGLEALIRSRPVELIDNPIAIASKILKLVLNYNEKSVKRVYDVFSLDPLEILTHIAVKRGWLYKKDREPNIEEAARAVIRDYLEGKIRFYSLPPTRKLSDSR